MSTEPQGLLHQSQKLSIEQITSNIKNGSLFSTLVYGDLNLHITNISADIVAKYRGSNDNGFDDNYIGYFADNKITIGNSSNWKVLGANDLKIQNIFSAIFF